MYIGMAHVSLNCCISAMHIHHKSTCIHCLNVAKEQYMFYCRLARPLLSLAKYGVCSNSSRHWNHGPVFDFRH
jgi:hypothetical protein